MSGVINLPTVGAICVSFGCNASAQTGLAGTGAVRFRLRVDGVITTGTTRTANVSGLAGLNVGSQEQSFTAIIPGLAIGNHTIEVLWLNQSSGTGSSGVTSDRSLQAFQIL